MKALTNSEVLRNIRRILKEKEIAFEEREHEAVFTSEQAAKARGLESEKDGIKSLIFKTENGEFLIILNPGNEKVDVSKIKEKEGVKHLSLAKPEEVKKVTGVTIGCVAPFGMRNKLKTYLNTTLLKSERLYFNPGAHTKTIAIKSKDLPKILGDYIEF